MSPSGTNGIACGKGRFSLMLISIESTVDFIVTFCSVWNHLHSWKIDLPEKGPIFMQKEELQHLTGLPSDARKEDVSEAMARALLRDMQPKTYYLRKEYGTRRMIYRQYCREMVWITHFL